MANQTARSSSATFKTSSEKARSVDVFAALQHRRDEDEITTTNPSTEPMVLPSGFVKPPWISPTPQGPFNFPTEIPGVPGEWQISGYLTPRGSTSYPPSPSTSMTMLFPTSYKTEKGSPSAPLVRDGNNRGGGEGGGRGSMSPFHDLAFIFNLCLAQLLGLASLAQTVVPLPIIAKFFNNHSSASLAWFTASYGLTVGTFILPAGRLGDMYGHKKVFMFGWVWFSISSLLCGFSKNEVMLSTLRGFQGIGPALLIPNAMALLGRTYPVGMKKNIVFSLFGACGPIGWVVGGTFSSICAQLGQHTLKPSGWAWSFFFLAIACLLICFMSFFVIPTEPPQTASETNRASRKFDWVGSITGVSGLVLINFAFNQAPLVGWKTYCPYLLVLGTIIFIGFIYVELNVAEQPLIPMRGLQKEAGFVLAVIGAGWASHGIWLFYMYSFLEIIRGLSPLHACAQTCLVAFTGTSAALCVGPLLKRMRVAYVMTLAMIFFTVGTILLVTTPVNQSYWAQTLLTVIIMPGGMNLSFPAGTLIMSNALPREHQGIAASMISTMVNYAISTGLGVAGSIAVNIDPNDTNPLPAHRGAWYFALGLDIVGLFIALWFVWKTRPRVDADTSEPA